MIAQIDMSMEQEQIYLYNMAQLYQLHRKVNDLFLLACVKVVSETKFLQEMLLVNHNIDSCLDSMYEAGIYNEADLALFGYKKSPEALAQELELPVEVLHNALATLREEGKLE